MKLIIDIDEETYKMCKRLLGDADGIERAVANGIPLKEHTWFDDCYPCTNCQEFECDGCKYNHKGEEE